MTYLNSDQNPITDICDARMTPMLHSEQCCLLSLKKQSHTGEAVSILHAAPLSSAHHSTHDYLIMFQD